MKRTLSRIISWGHELLAEVVTAGDLAVDLTAGRGQDTLLLSQLVGAAGQVIAFDLQEDALAATRARLLAAGACIRNHQPKVSALTRQAGVDLLPLCHSLFSRIVPAAPTAVIANLGYLPGGDQRLITRPETTFAALTQAQECLRPEGRLAVVVYPGHPGGREEADAVAAFFEGLPIESFEVIQLRVCNRYQAPCLFVAEKRAG